MVCGKLSLEASNSLLKLTKSLPNMAVSSTSEEDKLIPTIKSRVWSVHIDLPGEIAQARPHPVSDEEWAEWIAAGRKRSGNTISGNWKLDKGSFGKRKIQRQQALIPW